MDINNPNNLNGVQDKGGSQPATTEKGYLLKKHYVKQVNFQFLLQHPETYQLNKTPELNINVRAIPTSLGNDDFDVALTVEVKGSSEGQNLFETNVTYAGIFGIKNLSEQEKNGLLGVECPHLLYPFARRIVMDLILESGFPAANLPPINFAVLYAKQMKQKQAQALSGTVTTSPN